MVAVGVAVHGVVATQLPEGLASVGGFVGSCALVREDLALQSGVEGLGQVLAAGSMMGGQVQGPSLTQGQVNGDRLHIEGMPQTYSRLGAGAVKPRLSSSGHWCWHGLSR